MVLAIHSRAPYLRIVNKFALGITAIYEKKLTVKGK